MRESGCCGRAKVLICKKCGKPRNVSCPECSAQICKTKNCHKCQVQNFQ